MSRAAICVLSTCAVMWAAVAKAEDASGCQVSIGAVFASNSGREFDHRLDPMQKQFRALFPYTSYRLLKEESRNVRWGGPANFDLPGGRYLVVVPKEYKDGRVSLKILL